MDEQNRVNAKNLPPVGGQRPVHPVDYVSIAIGAAGVVVICWGVLLNIVRLVRLEIRTIEGMEQCHLREAVRHNLGSYLLLGLEILVAADIVKTIITPTLRQLAILASVVAIRTVLNYFLRKEIASGSCYTDNESSEEPSP